MEETLIYQNAPAQYIMFFFILLIFLSCCDILWCSLVKSNLFEWLLIHLTVLNWVQGINSHN